MPIRLGEHGRQRAARLAILTAIGMSAGIALHAPVIAQDAKASCSAKFDIRYAGIQAKDDPHTLAQNRFAEEVEQKTGGCVTTKVFFAQQYAGGNLSDITDQTHLGVIQMADTAPGNLSGFDPNFGVLALPFLFESNQAGLAAVDGPGGAMLAASLESKGLHLLGWKLQGLRNLCTVKPVRSLAELNGLRIRVIPAKTTQQVYDALGAKPVGMNFSEVPSALGSGVLDGLDMPIGPTYSLQLYNYCHHYLLTGSSFELVAMVMNGAFWNKLPKPYQDVVMAAARNSANFQTKTAMEAESRTLEALKEKGLQISAPSAEMKQQLRVATAGIVDAWRKDKGTDLLDALTKVGAAAAK